MYDDIDFLDLLKPKTKEKNMPEVLGPTARGSSIFFFHSQDPRRHRFRKLTFLHI